jgi:hypothetical protein
MIESKSKYIEFILKILLMFSEFPVPLSLNGRFRRSPDADTIKKRNFGRKVQHA